MLESILRTRKNISIAGMESSVVRSHFFALVYYQTSVNIHDN